MDRNGQKKVLGTGDPDTNCQPPCLLRYSPSLFAKEAPAVFEHDAGTNRLRIKPGHDPPWLRVNPPAADPNTWQYPVVVIIILATRYCR